MPSYSSIPALRSGIDAQFSVMTEFAHRSYDALRRLGELNMHFTQQILQDSIDASHQLLACSNPFQLAAAGVSASEPAVRHVRAYQRQLFGLLTGTAADAVRTASGSIRDGARSDYLAAQDAVRQAQASDAPDTSYHPEERSASPASHGGNGALHS
jgi:phasin family protein